MDPEASREYKMTHSTMLIHSSCDGAAPVYRDPCAGVEDDPHVKVMMAGSILRKVKSRSWKKNRHFRLLEDGLTIWYKSKWVGRGHSTCECTHLPQILFVHMSNAANM